MIIQVENPALELHDITVAYDRKPVLWGIDLTIPAGKLACIVGPNGAGKSTLIKAVMGLVPDTGGYAKIYGLDIRSNMEEIRKSLGMCPQHNVLFDK